MGTARRHSPPGRARVIGVLLVLIVVLGLAFVVKLLVLGLFG